MRRPESITQQLPASLFPFLGPRPALPRPNLDGCTGAPPFSPKPLSLWLEGPVVAGEQEDGKQ